MCFSIQYKYNRVFEIFLSINCIFDIPLSCICIEHPIASFITHFELEWAEGNKGHKQFLLEFVHNATHTVILLNRSIRGIPVGGLHWNLSCHSHFRFAREILIYHFDFGRYLNTIAVVSNSLLDFVLFSISIFNFPNFNCYSPQPNQKLNNKKRTKTIWK